MTRWSPHRGPAPEPPRLLRLTDVRIQLTVEALSAVHTTPFGLLRDQDCNCLSPTSVCVGISLSIYRHGHCALHTCISTMDNPFHVITIEQTFIVRRRHVTPETLQTEGFSTPSVLSIEH
jgi:hypothetical protein